MKKWKSIVSAFLAGIMILSAVVTVGAANVTFTDISSHWAKSQINYLVNKNVLNGYKQSNGTYIFKPDGTVTRAEFIKMLDETFGLTATAAINYSDVKTSDWFHPYFSKAAAQGYLLNYGTSVSPNGQLTREEATTLLVRYLGLTDGPKASASQFTDYYDISSNFRDPVMAAVQAGLINGYQESNGTYTFRPKNTLTRAEALTILYRAAGAIYNASAYSRDSGSADTNATITKGGVTLSGMTLSGRVIITEGVAGDTVTLTGCNVTGTLEIRGASNVILDGCTVSALTLNSVAPEIRISLTVGTTVASMTLRTKATMSVSSGCRITDLIVDTGAKNVSITGDGTIGKISVYAAGFVSTMMPSEFYVVSGLTANFASQPYSGSSDDQASFTNVPFITETSGQYYLNINPDAAGRVYYYFTDYSYVPTTGEFDSAYSAANYKDNFYVQAGKTYSESTFSADLVDRYDYMVIQLVTDDRTYAPVLIDNIPTSGTGFSVDPYYDGYDITYQADVTGTVYYYYSNDGDAIEADQFQNAYKRADSAMRGSNTITAGRSGSIALSERYLENYPFVIVVMQSDKGQYYKPVVVSAGDNGFSEEPAITTQGNIEYKTSVSGTLYYYYAQEDDMPTPQEFADSWRTEYGRSSVTVTRNRAASLTYDTNRAEMYPYMVFCIKDDDDNYLTPFVLKIDFDTGFSVSPYVSGTDEITMRAEHTGTIYWFFTKYNEVPAMNEFMNEFTSTTSARRGYENIRSTASYTTFTFDPSYAQSYPYIAIMLIDSDDNQYQPVLVDIKNTTTTGFAVDPYCDVANEAVYFKPSVEGTIYYYFSRTDVAYNETSDEFWDSYTYTSAYYRGSYLVDTDLDYIPFDSIDTNNYPGIVIMFVDDLDREYYPVYVSLTRDSSSGNSTTGITIQSVTSTSVKFNVDVSGSLKYYFQSTPSKPNATSTRYTMSVSRNITNEIVLHNVNYLYLILELDGYEPVTIDLSNEFDRSEEVTDGSNKSGSGMTNTNLDPADNGKITFTGIATVDGTVTMSLSNMVNSSQTVSVSKGSSFSISIPFDIDAYLGSIVGSIGGSVYVQLTASNGDVYERLEYPF